MANPSEQVREMQGLYGPFSIAERVVQKMWLRRDFEQAGLALTDGRGLQIRSPGTWNLLAGPDFKGARLVMDGHAVVGDVEVHFHSTDWHAHRHDEDRAYDGVVLHVLLFPPAPGPAARRSDGTILPVLVLLPVLHRGLEEYASDDALEQMTEQDAIERIAELAGRSQAELTHFLRMHAMTRWAMKVRFAAIRLERLGWEDAIHHSGLEILGYRRNRIPMLSVATAHPRAQWCGSLDPEQVFEEHEAGWQTQGIRPANHPRCRLRQYYAWNSARSDWPRRLLDLLAGPPLAARPEDATGAARKGLGLAELRGEIADGVLGRAVGGTRIDTLVCDGFLPLVAAQTGQDLSPLWFHWYLGDLPDRVRTALGALGLGGLPASPFCHGWAQGFLGWMAACEARASR